MSLKEVALEIADDLDKVAMGYVDGSFEGDLDIEMRLLAAQLRGACKAVGSFTGLTHLNQGKVTEYTEELKKQADRKKQQEQEHVAMMEKTGTSMIWCEGGPAHGTLIPAPGTIPIGATPIIAGVVYCMGKDGKLWYNEEETNKMLEALRDRINGVNVNQPIIG